ncbi:L,D-transpeptidase [Streptomyces varsoviensis]|uniref:L,D-transpeptidase n=1 Tax=Streptomyces varsoviensis TaxID=67373 RepID=UPI0004CBD14D|nr:Ig-like domain-containing protein [Streptomyces varsoviensis]
MPEHNRGEITRADERITGRRPGRRRARVLAAGGVAVAGALVLTACGGKDGASGKAGDAPSSASIAITPAKDTAEVATDKPVKVTASGGKLTEVKVVGPDGKAAPGAMGSGDTAWQSTGHLETGAKYTVTATAKDSDGHSTTQTSGFTTLKPKHPVNFKINTADGGTYGVGMPVSITFDQKITDKAAVQKALSVSTSPHVDGAWSWVQDWSADHPGRIDFRPKEYWKPGTKVTVKADLNGVNTGGQHYTVKNASETWTVGRSLIATADNDAHTLTVEKDGKKVKTLPVTLGAPGRDTWGGVMPVMDKQHKVYMTSQSVGFDSGEYHDWYYYAVHLTPSGTYAHMNKAADTLGGNTNETHGCIGMRTNGEAEWFYNQVIPGDVFDVKNAPKTVQEGNGYGDWNVSWDQWLAGSAIKGGGNG